MPLVSQAQSIIGKWQLVRQSTCLEENMPSGDEEEENLVSDMKSMGGKTPQLLQFKEGQNGEESTKILNSRKHANAWHFLYKVNDTSLYILDKKSHIIIDSYTIETLQSDSLILSNVARPCETKVFIRVK